jgi:hypothetical protein
MTMKPFEIQSPALSINGVLIDTSAQGKLVIPGVTRAGTSVAIEVEDTGDQAYAWTSDIGKPEDLTILDGYTYEVTITQSIQAQGGWTAATYAADDIDDEGYIDGISVVSGGTGYTGQAATYSQTMWAQNGDNVWREIEFKVRCGAGEIESEFGGGGGASALADLNDVQVDNPTNGQALVWNNQREQWENQTISGGGGSSDRISSPNSDYDAVLDNNGTLGIANGSFLALNTNGGGYSTTINGDGINMVWNGEQTGTIAKGPGGFSLNADSGKSVYVSTDSMNNNWEFTSSGGLRFPDNTVQTTAYTGQSSGSSSELYIMANLDGNIITSTDGITWGDPVASGMNAINRVEVHDGIIVYIPGAEGPPGSGQAGLYYSTVIGTTTLCSGTDTFMEAPVYWNNVHYFTSTNKWVAVGFIAGGTNHFPVVAYSDNGISWTLVPVDNTFATSFNPDNRDWDLTDVAYITESSQYVITSSILYPDTYGGIFVTQDITVALDGNTHLAVQKNFWEVASWSVTGYGGPSGYMILIPWSDGPGINSIPWFGFGTVVSNYSEASDGWWVNDVVNQIGYLPFISEVAYDNNDFIAVTGGGHVITPVFNGGPGFVVSIPLPYTTTDFSITNANPAVLTYSLTHNLTNNEKIVITDAGDFNGTYFWKESDGTLYTDQSLTTALDSSGFAAFASGGTLTASHGQYFDAAGTSTSYYYIGNDDEQVFRSSNGVDWTLQADVDGVYFNDFAYGAFGAPSVNRLDYTDPTTRYASSARLTYDFDVDVDNAHLNIRGDGSWDIGSSNFRTKIYSAGPEEPTLVIVQATDKYWTFSPDGKLNFPDGTRQQTAYVHRNINLDGGGAMAHYDIDVDVAFVDGGFSSTRHGVADASFDGGNRLTEVNQFNLDGGGA